MRVLALNCGSSSIKSALIDTAPSEPQAAQTGSSQSATGATLASRRLLDIRIENIGSANARLRVGEQSETLEAGVSFEAAVDRVLAEHRARWDASSSPEAIAHRVVHGGEKFIEPTLIDDAVLSELTRLNDLAPLHNPPAVAAIRQARAALPNLPHVAVFDTAFHATLPRRAREYALPADVRGRFGIRRFGFHGISHSHVASRVAEYMRVGAQELRIISCHLGNGASVAAIEYGRSIETSMGMTPLEGLVMGTRAGDIDAGILLHLLRSGEFDAERLDELLNRRSGLAGLAGTNDMREIERRAGEGDEECRLAITLYSHRLRKYMGAYAAVMGGVDVIAFTGGVGENNALVRHRCMQRLHFLGAVLDEDRNRDVRLDAAHDVAVISEELSRTKLLVVRADEELAIAIESAARLGRRSEPRPAAVVQGKREDRVTIPVAISARHAHLSQPTIERIFGSGYQLRARAPLSQTGQYSAQETISLIGPRGRLDNVRLMGPPRAHDQIEISRTDEFTLGVDAPVRLSGDLKNSPGITVEGPAGRATLPDGLISARRHIHMSPQDAERFGVRHGDNVQVKIDSDGRDLVFGDVTVRVSPDFRLELHLDTDEGNAAGIERGDRGEMVEHGEVTGRIGKPGGH